MSLSKKIAKLYKHGHLSDKQYDHFRAMSVVFEGLSKTAQKHALRSAREHEHEKTPRAGSKVGSKSNFLTLAEDFRTEDPELLPAAVAKRIINGLEERPGVGTKLKAKDVMAVIKPLWKK